MQNTSDFERKINKLRYYSLIVLGIASSITIIILVLAEPVVGIILLVLTWLAAILTMGYFGYQIRNLRSEQMRLQMSLQQQVYVQPNPTIYSQPNTYTNQGVYMAQPIENQPIYQESTYSNKNIN
jgi:hypothetical protein